jgi:hypothetical protein
MITIFRCEGLQAVLGEDEMFTHVFDSLFTNHNAGDTNGESGTDSREGPAGDTEISIENKTASPSACDLIYYCAAVTVLNVLNE